MNKKGMSLVELFLTLSIITFLLGLGGNTFNSLIEMNKIYGVVKDIRNSFIMSRYEAVKINSPIKIKLEENNLIIYKSRNNKWEKINDIYLCRICHISMNSNPVFFPNGYVSPTCSVIVEGNHYKYKITISFYGRIKVKKI